MSERKRVKVRLGKRKKKGIGRTIGLFFLFLLVVLVILYSVSLFLEAVSQSGH